MPPKLAKGMNPLGDISDEEASGSERSDDGDEAAPAAAKPAAKAPEVDYDALQRAGYRGCVLEGRCMLLCLVRQ